MPKLLFDILAVVFTFLIVKMNKLFYLFLILPFIAFGQKQTKKEYWNNGNVLSIINYSEGQRNGLCQYFYKSGQLMSEVNYKNGKMIGTSKSYHRNGQLHEIGEYLYLNSSSYSSKNGVWKTYNESGDLIFEYIIEKGKTTDVKSYNKQGELIPSKDGC